MARYIQPQQSQYVSQYVPKDLNFYQQQIDKSQGRYDATQAMYSEALAKLYDTPTLDAESRNKMIGQFAEGFDKVYNKYQGDLSKATGDILGLVSTARKDPFWQLNQYQVDQAKLEQQAKLAGKLIANSPSNKKIIDPETGQYTSSEALTTVAVDRPKYEEYDRLFISQLKPDIVSYIETIENDPVYQGMTHSKQIEYKKNLTEKKIRELAGKYAPAYAEYINNAQYEDNPYFKNLYNNPQAIIEHLTSMATPSIFSEIQEKPTGSNRGSGSSNSNEYGTPIPRGKYINWETNVNASEDVKAIQTNLKKYEELQNKLITAETLANKIVSTGVNNIDEYKQNIVDIYNDNPIAGTVKNISAIPINGIIELARKNPTLYKSAFDIYKINNPNSNLLNNVVVNDNGTLTTSKNNYRSPLEIEHTVFSLLKSYLKNTDSNSLKTAQSNLETEVAKDPMFSHLINQGATIQEAGEAIINLQQQLRLKAPTVYHLNSTQAETELLKELQSSIGLTLTPLIANELGAISKGNPTTLSNLKDVNLNKIEYVPSNGTFIVHDSKGNSYEASGDNLTEVPKDWVKVGKEVFKQISSTTPATKPIISRYAISIPKQNLDALMGEDTGTLGNAMYPGYIINHEWDKTTNTINPKIIPILVGQNGKTIQLDEIGVNEISDSIMDNLINTYTYTPKRVPIKYN